MARLLVGLPSLQGELQKYKQRFDLVELRPLDTSLPRVSTLRKWRKAVPPGFVFSVVLPRVVGELAAGSALDEALATSLEVAAVLEARCIVLQTPASLRPTASNRKKLAALFERLPAEGVVRCWEPSGIWEREDILATARTAKALPVLDVARDAPPPGPIVYTRLRALGRSAAMGAAALERIADRLRGRREVFLIVEGNRALQIKGSLAAALARKPDRSTASAVVRPAMPMANTLVAEDEEQ
ncbi:hypothetical protein SOCEGT47_041770 [Sorangium cellulosum]|jgi:uncharacterized protein YecE (DUF72 family)|uniref:DUF72 domain-containing protein n=1 Tax=Sorangium cellulosum TaxID=56 RepID=A0A4P2Q2Z8_SORCE|nr:DUF72 domain-containing protein [Sorangium cellulosum]AUX23649.1 hypothetical protein SOCEGT47_041770 [Sorangium cellulosum]